MPAPTTTSASPSASASCSRACASPCATRRVPRPGRIRSTSAKRRAGKDGAEIHLTPIEFKVLACLARHIGMVVTHRQLLSEVWGPAHAEQTHYLRIYMKQLRDKLEADPVRPRHLLTETGVGYRLVEEAA